MSCGYQGHEFGAHYPDSVCIDGYLWDADSGDAADDGGWLYTNGGDMPCPECNHETWRAYHAENYVSDGYDRAANRKWPLRRSGFKRDRLWAYWHQLRGAFQYYWDCVTT
jgi:hypothetical protein